MKDIQNLKDTRNLDIDRVGIKDIVYPVNLKDREKGSQHTIAKVNMYVKLPHQFKGTHMSRFVEIINEFKDNISLSSVKEILELMRIRLESDESHIEMSFDYFMNKTAPVSGLSSIMHYECSYQGSSIKGDKDFILGVKVPVLTLCPCSKEISKYGAHNQRSFIVIKARFSSMVWIEDLIEIAETSASCPVYPLLKREDEKYVTEKSYENPVFVEDVVRNAAEKLMADDRVIWFEVSSENMESIHNHSAYAVIERNKRG